MCQSNRSCALKWFLAEMYPEVVYFFAFLGFPSLGGERFGPRDCSLAGWGEKEDGFPVC